MNPNVFKSSTYQAGGQTAGKDASKDDIKDVDNEVETWSEDNVKVSDESNEEEDYKLVRSTDSE